MTLKKKIIRFAFLFLLPASFLFYTYVLREVIVAAIFGNLGASKILFSFGFDPNFKTANGYSPLMIAYSKKKLDVMELTLQKGGDPNYFKTGKRSKPKFTFPLSLPVDHGRVTSFSEPLIYSAILNNEINYFWLLCRYGANLDSPSELLSKIGDKVKIEDMAFDEKTQSAIQECRKKRELKE